VFASFPPSSIGDITNLSSLPLLPAAEGGTRCGRM
jgi:hypothetical protein